MFKICLILLILAVVLFIVIKVEVNNMSLEERIVAKAYNDYPTHIIVSCLVWLACCFGFVITLIISIITW